MRVRSRNRLRPTGTSGDEEGTSHGVEGVCGVAEWRKQGRRLVEQRQGVSIPRTFAGTEPGWTWENCTLERLEQIVAEL